MPGNNLQLTPKGRHTIGIPEGFSEPSFRVYFRRDAESGRKDWFFATGQQVFGPFGSFAEADEELSERRSASRFLPSLDF